MKKTFLDVYNISALFNKDNASIVENIYKHLKSGGYAVFSVMNLEITEKIAKYKVPNVVEHLEELVKLKPCKIMQKSGNIFDPEYYLLETETGVVYRKEQFENEDALSAEYVIRDKRYRCEEICELLTEAGFKILESRYVQAGRWEIQLDACDIKAKEILIVGKK